MTNLKTIIINNQFFEINFCTKFLKKDETYLLLKILSIKK